MMGDNAKVTGAEGVRVEGTVMQRAPCPAIVFSERIGGTDEQPLMAVHFCQMDEGHSGEHSAVHNAEFSGRPKAGPLE